ncbi:probable arabinosyltransferase ARAD1 isoform X2 [Malania oleifera]|uniref:probable arabinosyltransferase ARAD1 isoform X2 n=1 Tax=Malania oleifera TaxID=397392 RepID=UPI0025AE51F0|nr:probable arabinosyltransferase ARAD1 isoform X2 [Malania oleifera]
MIGKAAVSLVIVVLLILSYYIFIGTVDFRSQFFPMLQSPAVSSTCAGSGDGADRPLRVYMYDLPRRFHVGMLERRSSDDAPVSARNLPRWPGNTGLKRQHSVEYWMMASLLYEGGGGGRKEAVRVLDPESADVFFVPFFSSLSFNTHGHTMTDPETEIDRQLQYWQRSKGRDHVIPMHHPNAFRFLREQVNASILIVADFGRYPKTMSNLNKDVVAPYVHVVDSFTEDDPPDPFESRTTLLFFRGRTLRKAEGIVRAKLEKTLVGYNDVHYEQSYATTDSIKASTREMRLSKFCLHPAGDTPSSCRLFDAIVSHCVPVIVSDRIELPYEDEIDYSQFSIFFSVKEALKPDYMVKQLREVPKQRWIEMWRRLKNVSHHYEFQYPPKQDDAVNMLWRQVKHKLPGANLAVHRNQRLKVPDWWRRRR